jgi:MFS family permease
MLCSAVALPLLGKLGDLHGHRRIFLLGFAAATATAVATAFAWSASSLIGLRTLAAVVGGATVPTSMALVFGVYAPGDRVRAMGWWSMTTAAAPALGLTLGGPLVEAFGWRVVFVLQAVFSLAALALAAMVLGETGRQRVRFDLAGAGALVLAVGGFMWPLARLGSRASLAPAELWGPLLVGVLGIALFVRVERRTAEPLLQLAFFRKRAFSASLVSNAFQGAAYMGAFVLAPLAMFGIFRLSILHATAIMLLRTFTLAVASPLGARLGMRIGERSAATVGSLILTGSLLLIAWASDHEGLVAFGVGLVLQGLGHGLALPSLSSAVANAVPERDLGVASAGNRLTGTVGTAFGIAILTLVYGGENTGPAFAMAYLAGAGFAALSAAAAWLMQDPQEGACPDATRSA